MPSLAKGGGVPTVARFLKNVALESGRFDLKLISLCMSSDDPCSLNIKSPKTWSRGVIVSHGQWDGLPYHHVGAWAGEIEFQRYRPRPQLKELLADCDLVQVVGGYPAWANAVTGYGKPVALQVATRARIERRKRDGDSAGIAGRWRKAMTTLTNTLDDRALKLVDGIQVENNWMLEYAREINSGRHVDLRYAPPGIDTNKFQPIVDRNLDTDPYILCVGRLADPRKNISMLLEAYAQLPHVLRGRVRLVLAGSSAPGERFWLRARELGVEGRVSYVARPASEELIQLYQRACVFALPSDEEGLGIVLLEAMACGVPVISTRSGGPEGIIDDNQNGYLISLDDTDAMASGISRLLSDHSLNSRVGQNARRKAEHAFDQKVTGEVFIEMWERMATRTSRKLI